jgi:hypothetical protein
MFSGVSLPLGKGEGEIEGEGEGDGEGEGKFSEFTLDVSSEFGGDEVVSFTVCLIVCVCVVCV